MLFTNGTGTGKTYTGLGIIKRFLKWIFRSILTPESGKKLLIFSHFPPVISADTDPL
jgi:hypothetical protein